MNRNLFLVISLLAASFHSLTARALDNHNFYDEDNVFIPSYDGNKPEVWTRTVVTTTFQTETWTRSYSGRLTIDPRLILNVNDPMYTEITKDWPKELRKPASKELKKESPKKVRARSTKPKNRLPKNAPPYGRPVVLAGDELIESVASTIKRLQYGNDAPVNIGRLWGNFNKRSIRADFDEVLDQLVDDGDFAYIQQNGASIQYIGNE